MKKYVFIVLAIAFASGIGFWWCKWTKPQIEPTPKTIVVGTSADYPPFAFKEKNEIIGFDIAIIKELFRRIGRTVTFKNMPFELLIPQLQLGTIQIAAAGMTPTIEREKKVLFSDVYLAHDPLVMVTRAPFKPDSLDDLSGKTIVVNQGYTADTYISRLPNITVRRVPALADAILALRANKADAFVTAASTMPTLFKDHSAQQFETFVIPDSAEAYALAVSSRYPQLKNEIDFALADMQRDGTLATLRTHWFRKSDNE